MRHRKGNRKLSRATDQRIALLRSLTRSLLERGKITLTLKRAKETQKMAEKIIALGKYDTIAARRRVASLLGKDDLTKKIFSELATRFEGKAGGFTRVIKAGFRKGDAAPLAVLELT